MKGSTGAILAILLTFLLIYAVGASIDFSLTSGLTITRTIELKQDAYILSNALNAASEYLDVALKYSVYQALYDANRSMQTINEEDLKSDLANSVRTQMGLYTADKYSFLYARYKVGLPQYKKMEVNLSGDTLNVSASSDSPMTISRVSQDESVKMEKIYAPSATITSPVFIGYRSLNLTKAEEVLSAYMAKNWNHANGMLTKDAGCDKKNAADPQDLEVFNNATGSTFSTWQEAESNLANSMEAELDTLKSNYTIETSNTSAAISHPCRITATNDNCLSTSPSYLRTKECNFSYSYGSDITLSVVDMEKQFPVSVRSAGSSTILFKPLKLSVSGRLGVNRPFPP